MYLCGNIIHKSEIYSSYIDKIYYKYLTQSLSSIIMWILISLILIIITIVICKSTKISSEKCFISSIFFVIGIILLMIQTYRIIGCRSLIEDVIFNPIKRI